MDKAPEAFRTISEVADWLGVQPHVLRFWESKFPQIKPVKRAGGRRYYRPNDMLLLGGLRKLLHDDGLTIKGAQKVLREQGVRAVQAMSDPLDEDDALDPSAVPQMAPDPQAPASTVGQADAGDGLDMPDAPREALATAEPDAPTQEPLPEIRKRPRPGDLPAAQAPDTTPTLFDHAERNARADMSGSASGTPPSAQTPSARTPVAKPPATPEGEKDPAAPPDSAAPAPADAQSGTAQPAAPAVADMAQASPARAAPAHPAPVAAAPTFRSRLGGMISGESAAPKTEATSAPAPQPPAQTGAPDSSALRKAAPRPALPASDLPLDTALSMLEPGQVPAIRLRPIYEQMVALRGRMDAAS